MSAYEATAGEWRARNDARWKAADLRQTIEPCIRAMERAARVILRGMFAPYAWPGGYPILYIDTDGETLCADCAKAEYIERGTRFAPDIYYEGPGEQCAVCNRTIESAYGDPEEGQ